MIRASLRRFLWDTFPSMMLRRDFKRRFWHRQCATARRFYGTGDVVVMSGPFRGTKYINETVWGPIEPKWLGSYEQELHGVVTDVLTKAYETIIDVGSAEGFYSVGLALKLPSAHVFSYEIDPWARRQQRRLANLNHVSNLTIAGFCTHKELDARSRGRTLVICDIEGAESELLDPAKAHSLRYSDCLVELHDSADLSMRRMEALLLERFRSTHSIERIEMADRLPQSLHEAGLIPEGLDAGLLDEDRSQRQVWLWMLCHRHLTQAEKASYDQRAPCAT